MAPATGFPVTVSLMRMVPEAFQVVWEVHAEAGVAEVAAERVPRVGRGVEMVVDEGVL